MVFIILGVKAQKYEIKSPNSAIKLKVELANAISWTVSYNGNVVIEKAEIGLAFTNGTYYGLYPKVKKHTIESHSEMIYPAVPHKDSEIKDQYEELSIDFTQKFQLHFRAYNDGVAYRFVDKNKQKKNVLNEQMILHFPTGSRSLFPKEESMYSHNERFYLDRSINEIARDTFCSLPVLFDTEKAKVVFSETALHNYPGMFIRGNSNNSLDAVFPKYVLKAIDNEKWADRNQIITEEAEYIAQTAGKIEFPWRVFVISDDDRTLVESNLTYQLAKPQAIENTGWIKPGRVAWDWYNANNIYGVDFESGLNTATYKYYIDFAAANGIEYVILDEGWTKSTTNILDFNPDMDVRDLISYGKEKGVELILWVLWKPLDANMDEILETYKSWGAKGIKVDFMQRNDQYMVGSYERIAKKCAELELLVDYHGAFKPSGLRRVYPNVLNYEGVKGAENNKWTDEITPEHNVTIPFIRMVAGPMDYTPGAMSNAHKTNFNISWERPMSLGTRAHQLAMYVVYEAPLQMLCESPSRYKEEQESLDFMTQIPTVWDETHVLHGAVGEYIVIARRNGDKWYIGAMTNSSSRELEVDLSFLNEGDFVMDVFKDGMNANRFAEDYKRHSQDVNNQMKIPVKMASGGGWVAIISAK